MPSDKAAELARARENGIALGQIQTKVKVLCEKSDKLEAKMEKGLEGIDHRLDGIEKAIAQCPILKGEEPWKDNPGKPDNLRKLKLWAVIVTAVVGGGVTLPFLVKLLDGLFVVIRNAAGVGG
jgi:hypothetical protein